MPCALRPSLIDPFGTVRAFFYGLHAKSPIAFPQPVNFVFLALFGDPQKGHALLSNSSIITPSFLSMFQGFGF
jgi:hypothetical protein